MNRQNLSALTVPPPLPPSSIAPKIRPAPITTSGLSMGMNTPSATFPTPTTGPSSAPVTPMMMPTTTFGLGETPSASASTSIPEMSLGMSYGETPSESLMSNEPTTPTTPATPSTPLTPSTPSTPSTPISEESDTWLNCLLGKRPTPVTLRSVMETAWKEGIRIQRENALLEAASQHLFTPQDPLQNKFIQMWSRDNPAGTSVDEWKQGCLQPKDETKRRVCLQQLREDDYALDKLEAALEGTALQDYEDRLTKLVRDSSTDRKQKFVQGFIGYPRYKDCFTT